MAALEIDVSSNTEQQSQEYEFLRSMYSDEMTVLSPNKEYLINIAIASDESINLSLKSHTGAKINLEVPPSPTVQSTTVSHLPPVTLYIRYNGSYPSTSCPNFHLSSRWLNHKYVELINSKMHELFNPGWPVVYDWILYITNDLLKDYCNIEGIDIDTQPVQTRHINQIFVRSISEFNDVEEHDQYENHKRFLTDKHECGICTELKYGEQFCDPCKECDGPGLYCKSCISEYCQTLLSEGRVTKMSCPNPTCTKELTDTLLESLLQKEQYQKYLHLKEEVHLDSIPGMVFCPRTVCGSRVISEPQSDLAVCEACQFPFCKLCRQTWHGIEPCTVYSKVTEEVTEEQEKGTKKKPRTQDETQRRIEELKSMLWLRSHRNVKQCPKCSASIQKIGGCNKMTCWKCGSYFCWLCEELIAGYIHFDTKNCKLFRNEDYLPPEEEKESNEASANLPDQEEQLEKLLESACPRCGLVEQKSTNNNWVHCRRCQLPFCLLCHEPCFGQYHFSEYGCKQFTTLKEDMQNL